MNKPKMILFDYLRISVPNATPLCFSIDDLMRIKRIKRREFMWCHGVTAGFIGKNMRGTVQVIPNGETVRAFGHPINTFYLRNGIPVYVVKLNVNGNSLLKGGFISDPLAFRIKD